MTTRPKIIATAALAALALVGYATTASAYWVKMDASWCRHRGFSGACWQWFTLTEAPNANPASRSPTPKAGDIRAATVGAVGYKVFDSSGQFKFTSTGQDEESNPAPVVNSPKARAEPAREANHKAP